MNTLGTAEKRTRLTIGLCFIVALLEGMDLQAMGIAAPSMAAAFGFEPGQMGLVFSASILGLLPGAFLGGWFSDRIGRKKVLIASVILFGVFSLASAHVWDMSSLLVARFMTGIGLGGALPNLIALSSESAGERARNTAVSLMYCGVPLGGALAAVVGLLDTGLGWRTVFYVGGIAPLLVAPLLAVYLVETAQLGLNRQKTARAVGTWDGLFRQVRASTTLMLWLSYFFTLTVMYMLLNWLPSLLVGQGFTRSQAVTVQILFNIGGGIGSVLFGLLMDRWRPKFVVVSIYAGILAGLAGLGLSTSFVGVIVAGFVAGLFVVGGQLVLYALAPQVYPTVIRATGVGSAVAVGRLGAMAGPLLAGQILAMGGAASTLVAATSPGVVIAAVSVLCLLNRQAGKQPAGTVMAGEPAH
ncbi:AAHS family 3-hydroxyphenylpropionic acid transporter [Pseudomonas duriflava]|uniref:AAHS family 3-hydroxyphenylpropionic acid transporter n=1 Tax=Pseudomonas duriflava TaxID=459528 RepID=A0A562QE71_9PSED|nr:3-(3-hydroxy-phenyl)propionate transporter MhpT [Pseudomonas duriflava]TWI55048.1 AAHS family 3-hydroxyphenylpropionic acid transporter [Pseudomonas duriflava]